MDPTQASWIEREKLLVEFDQKWRAGNCPRIDEYISRCPDNSSDAFLRELINVDLEYQWKSGRGILSEHYLEQFGQLRDDPENRWRLLAAELAARAIVEKLPDEAEITRRFPGETTRVSKLIDSLITKKMAPSSSNGPVDSAVGNDARQRVVSNSAPEVSSAGTDLKPDDVIGHYQLFEKIGFGTFANVWSAKDDELGRKVAIKILNQQRLGDPDIIRRMMREARAVAQLEHPSIIQVFDVGKHQGLPFIVTKLIEGPTLQHCLAHEHYTVDESAQIISKIAKGIHFAHTDGIVHRDLKPANILMPDRMNPMIADFGLAHHANQPEITLTLEGDILGTPAYMSPEQATGDVRLTDPRTDIYSLGVLLYQLLTKRLPFEGSISSVMHKVMNDTPPNPKSLNPSIHRDLETVVLKCLEKSPSNRYSTADELDQDLQRYLRREPIKARPVGIMERTIRLAKKRPRIAALLTATILLSGFLIGSLFQLNEVRTQKEATQVLLAQTERDAGRLAMQRGRVNLAIQHFEKSQSMGGMREVSEQLYLIEALVGTRNTKLARQLTSTLDGTADKTPSETAAVRFWQAVLSLEEGDLDKSIDLFEQSIQGELSDSDRKFAEAMLSDSTPQAIKFLQQAVDMDPLSHHARRMLLWQMLSLADFEDLEKQLKLANHLFPGDQDFMLLWAILYCCQDDLESSDQALRQCEFDEQQLHLWQQACASISGIIRNSTHQQGTHEFNERRLQIIVREFMENIWPAMKSRGLYFPPRISRGFEEFCEALNSNGLDNEHITDAIAVLVDIYPEPSLLLLLAAQHTSNGDIEKALKLSEQALANDGFVFDTREVAIESVAACSVFLMTQNTRNKIETDKELYRKFVYAVELFEFEPKLIKKYSTQQSGTAIITGLIDALTNGACNKEIILRWLSRMESAGEATPSDIHWIKTIVAMKTENWFRVIELCDIQLESLKQGAPTMPKERILAARDYAKQKIRELNFSETADPDENN